MWNRSEAEIELVLIRHGITKGNESHRYLGSTDEGLSEKGKAVLKHDRDTGLYNVISDHGRIWSSPMKRCIETAGILFPMQRPCIVEEWKEMNFGEFEYKHYAELNGDKRYQAWIDSGGVTAFPGGESRAEFIARTVSGFHRIADDLDTHAVNIAVVHGGTIMALMSQFTGRDYFDFQIKPGQGYICHLKREKQCLTVKNWSKIE